MTKDQDKAKHAQSFARDRHKGYFRKDGTTPFYKHLEEVVARLKNLGITDEDVLCAGWLHDTIEDTETAFDEIDKIFGKRVALLVLSLTKDKSLPKKQRETEYVKLLRTAPLEAKLIKLCDAASNLASISSSSFSQSYKSKKAKTLRKYINTIIEEIAQNTHKYPKITETISGINSMLKKHRQRPVSFRPA